MKYHYLSVMLFFAGVPFLAQGTIGPEPSSSAPRDFNAPALPSGVQLISNGKRVDLLWTDPPDADFYYVEILRNDGTGTAVTGDTRVRVGKGIQRYEDVDVRAGQTYQYRLRVADLSLNTRLSDEYEVTVPAPAPATAAAPLPAPSPPAAASAPAPAASIPAVGAPAVSTPGGDGAGEELRAGAFAYGFSRVRVLTTEQALARALAQGLDERLPGVFNRLFHQKTGTSKQWWYGYVNAYIYGGYTLDEIKQSVRFGGKTVHPAIPAARWRNAADYQAYINR